MAKAEVPLNTADALLIMEEGSLKKDGWAFDEVRILRRKRAAPDSVIRLPLGNPIGSFQTSPFSYFDGAVDHAVVGA